MSYLRADEFCENTKAILRNYPRIVKLVQGLERVRGRCPSCFTHVGHRAGCEWFSVWELITKVASAPETGSK